jgi:hypothetical protein
VAGCLLVSTLIAALKCTRPRDGRRFLPRNELAFPHLPQAGGCAKPFVPRVPAYPAPRAKEPAATGRLAAGLGAGVSGE